MRSRGPAGSSDRLRKPPAKNVVIPITTFLGEPARLTVDLASVETPGAGYQAAAALLLLTTSNTVRLVRPVWDREDGQLRVGVEAELDPAAGGGEIDAAVQCLALASDLCHEELLAFEHEDLARNYLAIRGGMPGEPSTHPEQKGDQST